MQRPTIAEIDLSAVLYNLSQVRERIGRDRYILAVVKADAYGHGALNVSKTLISGGVNMLGVALIEEGVELRESGIDIPILVMGGIFKDHTEEIVRYNLTPAVSSRDTIMGLADALKKEGRKSIRIHIKIDTGMGRLGFSHKEAINTIKWIYEQQGISIEGIMTHFADADIKNKEYAQMQIKRFRTMLDSIKSLGINIPLCHTANSAAIIDYEDAFFNMVRPGIMLYGYLPSDRMAGKIDIRSVMSLKTKIVHLKKVSPCTSISYGRTFTTKRESIIATLPVGYADGYNRLLSNCGEVIIKGKRFPVIGRVCMDNTMIDVTGYKDISVGDDVILIGRDGEEVITASDIAGKIGTIPYEVLCNISKRVPRIYLP
ncbi:MAG: alanine racemase [Nitrospirota bacterium]